MSHDKNANLIGDLARVLSSHNGAEPVTRRKPDEHRVWADIVIRNASPGHVVIFNDAWQEFQLAKEAAGDSPD